MYNCSCVYTYVCMCVQVYNVCVYYAYMCGGVCVCVCVHMCMFICMDLYSIPMSFYCIDSALEHINL